MYIGQMIVGRFKCPESLGLLCVAPDGGSKVKHSYWLCNVYTL